MLKYFIAKIKLRIRQNKCYKARKKLCFAAGGRCRGHYHDSGIPYKGCSICPYFVKRSADNGKK